LRDLFCNIESSKASSELLFPLNCQITRKNDELGSKDFLKKLNQDPESAGIIYLIRDNWLIEVEPSPLEELEKNFLSQQNYSLKFPI
jgi:glycine cleavage system H lipoate-binding protein